jgi:hypothetical protein
MVVQLNFILQLILVDDGATTVRKQGILKIVNDSLFSYNPKIQIAGSRLLTSVSKSGT